MLSKAEKKQLLERAAEVIRKDEIRLERNEDKLFNLNEKEDDYKKMHEILSRRINRLQEKIESQVYLTCRMLGVSFGEVWDEILELNK